MSPDVFALTILDKEMDKKTSLVCPAAMRRMDIKAGATVSIYSTHLNVMTL